MSHWETRHLPPLPHMARCAEEAEALGKRPSGYELKIDRFMAEFGVDRAMATQMVDNDTGNDDTLR